MRRQVDERMRSSGLSTQATVVDRSESDDEMPLVRVACQARTTQVSSTEEFQSSKRSRQSELQVAVPTVHSQPTCPVVDMTQEDSVSETRSDSGLSSVLNALEADLAPLCDRPEASESDTESLRLPPRRRLVIWSAPQLQQPDEKVDSRGEALCVPEEIGMKRGLESLDVVDIAEVFSVRAVVMKSVPRFPAGAFRGALKVGL